jgi:hypothetical protein
MKAPVSLQLPNDCYLAFCWRVDASFVFVELGRAAVTAM